MPPVPPGGVRLDPWLDRYAGRATGMTASAVRALFAVASRPEVVSLAGGAPYVSALPLDALADLAARLLRESGAEALQYGGGQGTAALRERICTVMAVQGIDAHPDDVVVTTGSQQALDLLTRLFVDPGDVVVAEAPSYVGALAAFRSYQARVVHVPMDDDGVQPEALAAALQRAAAAGRPAKLFYTVPNFHNPAGVTLSAARRPAVLDVCRRAGVLVVEDDPYGLLGFEGDPPAPLRADPSARGDVVYLGTFSKTFAPGLRVGWALAPHGIRDKLVLAAEATQLCPSTFAQLAVTSYLDDFAWLDQVKVFRELYRERRDTVLAALAEHLPAGSTWTRPAGGFFVWLTLPPGIDTTAMLPRAVRELVAYTPGSAFFADMDASPTARHTVRLSYCHPTPERLREGVRRFAAVVERELDVARTFATTDATTDAASDHRSAADAHRPAMPPWRPGTEVV